MSPLSYRMLNIGSAPAGLLGMEELFAALFDENISPQDADVAERLIAGIRQYNFIPSPALEAYKQALLLEYGRYFHAKESGKAVAARNYGSWQGYPREQIPWFPTLSRDLCTDCGACVDLCGRDVYAVDEDGHVWVAEPFLCMVGCCFCKSVCEPKALLFPSQDLLKNYRQKM